LRLGLLSILACPICKYYPLKLNIFKWETDEEKFKQVEDTITEKKIEQLKNETIIKIIKNEKELRIKDNIVRSEKNFNDYIEELKKINDDILAIRDDSKTISKKILKIIIDELFSKIPEYKKDEITKNQIEIFEEIKYYIYLLNWYLFYPEIEEGIMFCNKCNRWFPITETIPQMLPDEVRREKPEKDFLKKWKDLIEDKIIIEGKPFNLKE